MSEHRIGVIMIMNSWATRIRPDDTMVVQIDGTDGSAVAGRFRCWTQAAVNTPEAFFGGGQQADMDFRAQCQEVPDTLPRANPLRHVAEDAPYGPDLIAGAKAVQLADLAYRSVAERSWMDVAPLSL